MNRILEGALAFVAVMLLLLGVIFVIAGGTENLAAGAVMILIGLGILLAVYRVERAKADQPTVVKQTFNVKMEGSGELREKEMKCRSCGAPLSEKDLKVIQGGIMVNCAYCGAAYALEEKPKW